MRLRKWLDEMYARGFDDAHRRPMRDPFWVSGGDGKYARWAYDAGWKDGVADLRLMAERLARIQAEGSSA